MGPPSPALPAVTTVTNRRYYAAIWLPSAFFIFVSLLQSLWANSVELPQREGAKGYIDVSHCDVLVDDEVGSDAR